jgi:hypothetical protein
VMKPCSELNVGVEPRLERVCPEAGLEIWVVAHTGSKRFRGQENVGKRMILMASKWGEAVWQGKIMNSPE